MWPGSNNKELSTAKAQAHTKSTSIKTERMGESMKDTYPSRKYMVVGESREATQ